MCRNIKNLFNFDPPVTEVEVRDASLQFVRKIEEIAAVSARLLASLETNAPPKDRDEEASKRKARSAERFAS